MRVFIFISLIFSFNVFAVDFCNYKTTQNFQKKNTRNLIKITESHDQFSEIEIEMIAKAMRADSLNTTYNKAELLKRFSDISEYTDGHPGPDAGEIVYYDIDDNKFQLVHYWPGDNEYGAFVKVQHGKKVVVLATIVDGIIRCN